MKRLMYSGTGLLVLLLAFIAFNISTGTLLPGARLDLTEQKLYTISDGTRQILKDLDEPVTLYFFFSQRASKDLVILRNYARRVEEMLREYERVADGKLILNIIDPQPFSEAEDRAAEFGLQAVPLAQTGEQLYFGLAGSNELAQREVIPFFAMDQEGLLEYELSRLIHTLAQVEKPQVGVISALPLAGGMNPMTGQPSAPWVVYEQLHNCSRCRNWMRTWTRYRRTSRSCCWCTPRSSVRPPCLPSTSSCWAAASCWLSSTRWPRPTRAWRR